MDTELSDAQACCIQSLEQIQDKLEAVDCLEEFLPLAPSLTKPMVAASLPSVLWRIAKGAYDWKRVRPSTSRTLDPIVTNRIKFLVELELLRHQNNAKLSKQWSTLLDQLTRDRAGRSGK